jgi:hypothetical protein
MTAQQKMTTTTATTPGHQPETEEVHPSSAGIHHDARFPTTPFTPPANAVDDVTCFEAGAKLPPREELSAQHHRV